MMSMNFFELLGVSSDQLADAMPERIVEVGMPATATSMLPPAWLGLSRRAFHTGGKEAVREVVYNEVADKLRAPLHVRAAEPGGGEAVYGAGQPGRPVFLVKDAKDLFTRVHEDGTPYTAKEEPLGAPPAAAAGGAPRARKPRPSGGMGGGGGQSARDKERDATWETKYQNLLHFVRTHGHRPRRTGEDKERQMCFWLAQQQRKMKDGSLPDDKRERLGIVLAVKGPAARLGGGSHSGGAHMGGGSEQGDDGADGEEGGDGDGGYDQGDGDGGDDGEGGYDDDGPDGDGGGGGTGDEDMGGGGGGGGGGIGGGIGGGGGDDEGLAEGH
ncbi:hypothetical protein MNEG_1454 [Monoraphidium neglectum]|uniref:Helicase-associated domain-containing protein n=1 Tax=Monoraphidium neglectum TaxID=145388 RepID=A0A0D2MVC6_9CHLO|nr:hypothetical protein MNEG_1454 [Monoraphidium neglectum]KIZ06490.1 hypothetical protein MNEG_1454 [Monoraphidium neglectum]|eukprot:XP_013905509.1 hypothetical protein MNEG_1454 [Monoraphidium neglectum]